VEQNILRLDVTMNDALSVRIVEGARDFRRDSDGVGDRKLLFLLEALTE
jgi:hypothetical protein